MNPTDGYQERSHVPALELWKYKGAHLRTPAQIAFKNILFATDFSSTTGLALPYAVEIARRLGATIHVVHVVHPEFYPLLPPSEWAKMAHDEENFRKEKKQQLENELQECPHKFLFPVGDVWQNVENIIANMNIDLLILGTHGRTGIGKIVMGSVAETIFRQATCPVLTVGPDVSPKLNHAAPVQFNRILYATDFSPESLVAAPYAMYLAKENRAELILMNSIQNAEANSAYHSLRDVIPASAGLESNPKCVIEQGMPQDTILDVAARHHVDMIVLGVRNAQGPLQGITRLSRSIACVVATQATCPVLTVRG